MNSDFGEGVLNRDFNLNYTGDGCVFLDSAFVHRYGESENQGSLWRGQRRKGEEVDIA